MWELSHQSADQLVALLKRLRIRCDLKTRDAVYYATTAQAAERLRHECELRARSGFDAEWLGPGQLRRLTGIAGHGAILSKGSAQFDPYRACVGIFRTAAAAGANVFERSEVRRIEKAHNGVRIRTRQGTLHAERVVIATGYATAQFRPLAGRFRMYRTYLLATEPIDSVQRDDVGCPTSWSGTPSGLTTMLAGHRSIDFSWAARTAWYSPVNGVVNSPDSSPRSAGVL